MHSRDVGSFGPLTSSWRGSENLRAAFPFKMDVAAGLADAYIAK